MITSIPTLETERLILRAWRQSDAAPFIEMSADEELMRYVGGAMDPTAGWRRMAAYAGSFLLKGYGTFALEDKASGELVGYSGVFDPVGWPEREINWGLRSPYLGRGYVTEAATRVRDHVYDDLGFTTIASCIDQENAASIAVAKRLGATLDRVVIGFRGRPVGVWRHVAPDARRAAGDRSMN
jgi:RimJ/RimL family protein N-acetyltransferase